MTVCNMTASLRDLALSHLLIQYVHVFELFFPQIILHSKGQTVHVYGV